MKTLKALKISFVLNCIFCIFCILSTLCLVMDRYFDIAILFAIGQLSIFGWLLNPLALISSFWGLKTYLKERKTPEQKKLIGNSWIWACVWPVITTVLWLVCMVLFVQYTGGA